MENSAEPVTLSESIKQQQLQKKKTYYSVKEWHQTCDQTAVRTRTINEIARILPLDLQHHNRTVPTITEHLENTLFHEANTLEEYADKSTLKDRLQQLLTSFQKPTSSVSTVVVSKRIRYNIHCPFTYCTTRTSPTYIYYSISCVIHSPYPPGRAKT